MKNMKVGRNLFRTLGWLGSLGMLWACGSAPPTDGTSPAAEAGQPYRVAGMVVQDSLHADAPLRLCTDRHSALTCDTVAVRDGHFVHEGRTADVDELFLYTAGGRAYRFYAAGGQDLGLEIDSMGSLHLAEADSLNTWLAAAQARLDTLLPDVLQRTLDTLCRANRTQVRAALLLRRYLPQLPDSVGIRRTLGALAPQAKPAWLMQEMEEALDRQSLRTKDGGIAATCKIQTSDSLIDLLEKHPNGYLILFWADYAPLSVDSLRIMDDIARQYGLYAHEKEYLRHSGGRQPKRLELMTVCLHATDSAAWRDAVRGVPGHHAWMQAGLNDPRIRRWQVEVVPQVLLLNQNGAVCATTWGSDLRRAIDRLPNRAKPADATAAQKSPTRPRPETPRTKPQAPAPQRHAPPSKDNPEEVPFSQVARP